MPPWLPPTAATSFAETGALRLSLSLARSRSRARSLSLHTARTVGLTSRRNRSVKEMDPGQIGLVIKILNLATGFALSIWAGVMMVIEIGSYVACDETTVDPECCPGNPAGATECAAPMSLYTNFSAFVISLYMVPLGIILILYEISTKRVGSQEVG